MRIWFLGWTYHSNAIDGNTLTLMETKVVLDGITVGGKSMREHFEAINHREAIFYFEDLLKNEEALSEPQIKSLHQLLLKNIDEQNAGAYRQQNVVISGAFHTPVDYLHVPAAMKDLLKWRQSFSDTRYIKKPKYFLDSAFATGSFADNLH